MAGGCLWFSPQLSPERMNTHQLCGKRQRRWHNTVQCAEDTWDLQITHKTGLAVLFTGCVTDVTQMYPVQTRTKGGCWWAAELPSACLPQLHQHCACSCSKPCVLGVMFTLEMSFLKSTSARPKNEIKHKATNANECSHTWECAWNSMFPVPLSGYCSSPCKNNLVLKLNCPDSFLWQTHFKHHKVSKFQLLHVKCLFLSTDLCERF